MRRIQIITAALALAVLAATAACGGGSAKNTETAVPATVAASSTAGATKTAAPSVTSAATTAATAPTSAPAAAGSTPVAGATSSAPAEPPPPVAGATSPGDVRVYNLTQAQALLNDASLTLKDLPADWTTTTDTPQDNAAAAAADATMAASNERCGRLFGRTVVNTPKDVVAAYLGGSAVSYFSALNVFATAAGAADCAAETAVRLVQPGQLAKAFGPLFIHPEAVVVKPIDYPQIGDGSFATALTGDINAAGTTVQLQIVVVGFRVGNVSGAVGTAYAPLTNPTTTELAPYVSLVTQRIRANH